MGPLEFLRDKTVGVKIVGASVTKYSNVFKEARENVKHVQTASAKRNSGYKSKLSDKDRTRNVIIAKQPKTTGSNNSIQFNFICIALFTIQDCHKAALQRALA